MLNINNYMHRSNVFKVYLDLVIFVFKIVTLYVLRTNFMHFFQCLKFHDLRIRYLYSSGISFDNLYRLMSETNSVLIKKIVIFVWHVMNTLS